MGGAPKLKIKLGGLKKLPGQQQQGSAGSGGGAAGAQQQQQQGGGPAGTLKFKPMQQKQ
jgi:hypothetical protein